MKRIIIISALLISLTMLMICYFNNRHAPANSYQNGEMDTSFISFAERLAGKRIYIETFISCDWCNVRKTPGIVYEHEYLDTVMTRVGGFRKSKADSASRGGDLNYLSVTVRKSIKGDSAQKNDRVSGCEFTFLADSNEKGTVTMNKDQDIINIKGYFTITRLPENANTRVGYELHAITSLSTISSD